MKFLKRQSKRSIIFLAVFAGLIISALILLAVFWPKDKPGTSFSWIFFIVMILAMISIVLFFVLAARRSKYASFLKDDYYKAYDQIAHAMQNSTLSTFEQREVLMDIANLFLHSQEKGRPINKVVKNVDDFVEKIKSSFGYRNSIIFNLFSGIKNFIFTITIAQIAIYLIRGTDIFFETTLGLTLILYLAVLSFVLLPLLKYLVSKQKITWFIVSLVVFVGLYLGSTELLNKFGMTIPWVQTYLEKEVTFISSWIIVAILVIIMALTWVLKWLIRRQSIKNL